MELLNNYRPISVYADGTKIAEELRVRVKGSLNMTLFPDFFSLEMYNLSDADMAVLQDAKKITISGEDEYTICTGEIEDVFVREEGVNTIASVSVVDGKSFWMTKVSKTLGGGAEIEATITNLVQNVKFGGFFATNKRIIRGQTYTGRLADNISMLAKSASGRAFVSKGVLYIIQKGKASETVVVEPGDVINDFSYAKGSKILKTVAKGYPIGAIVRYGGRDYRLVSQKFDLDNYKGDWASNIIIVDEQDISPEGMVGG